MDKQDVQKHIEMVLNESDVGAMATVKNNKPYSRYMMFKNDDLTLYTATNTETEKVEDIEGNPYTHILLGYTGGGLGDEYIEYEGKVTIDQSESIKQEMWNEDLEQWFEGPDDPNYAVLKIDPIRIQLMNKDGVEPHVWEN